MSDPATWFHSLIRLFPCYWLRIPPIDAFLDLPQLSPLKNGQRCSWCPLFRITKGGAEYLQPLRDAPQEPLFPLRCRGRFSRQAADPCQHGAGLAGLAPTLPFALLVPLLLPIFGSRWGPSLQWLRGSHGSSCSSVTTAAARLALRVTAITEWTRSPSWPAA